MHLKRWLVRSSLVLCAVSALCSAPQAARAQGPAADNDAIKRARDQFSQALSLQTAGDWAGALAMLKEVAAVKPTPQVRFNIALCEERLGRVVAALGDYELAASDAQAEKADQVRQEVDSRLESLKARVPRVIVQRGQGADSATIALDGVSLGDSVLNNPLPVDPGPHTVEATALGFQPFKQTFRVAEQQTATIQVKLEPVPTAVPPRTPVVEASHASRSVRSAGFIVGGVGIASLITSGAMFYLRQNTISDLDKQCGVNREACPPSSKDTMDRGKLYTTVGDVTLVAGAVGLGLGAALVIVGSHSTEHAGVALAPGAAGANIGGASLFGRF
ncbi:MAG: hypothetical protein ABI488_07810 [Polyangiaceae bacterium]